MTGSIAKRYARALFGIASEQGTIEAAGEELVRVVAAFRDERLAALARSPAVGAAGKRAVAREVAERMGVSETMRSFLALLGERDRLDALEAIGERYASFVDAKLGRVRARIASARPLTEEDRRRVTRRFEEMTGKTVLADAVVDPDLLGGVRVEIGGRVYDGTVRTQLESIKSALAG